MNSARTLADRFRTQRTDRIRVDGVEVLSLVELTIEGGDAVEVMVEQSRPDIEQSLHVRSKRADLQVVAHAASTADNYEFDSSIVSGDITLVANQERRIEFVLADDESDRTENDALASKPVTLQIWNSWLIGDAEHAWIGNSGIVVDELDVPEGASARFRLWCSDGLGDPQFDDLVAVITVGQRV